MDALFFFGVMTVLGLFATFALSWGVDSRDGSADPRRPEYPVGISI